MTGHEPILAMRRAGVVPAAIFVLDADLAALDDWQNHPNPWDGKLYAEVQIAAADAPELLDLRFAVGQQIHVKAWRDAGRGKRLHKAFSEAGAALVLTSLLLGNPYRPDADELWIYDPKNQLGNQQ